MLPLSHLSLIAACISLSACGGSSGGKTPSPDEPGNTPIDSNPEQTPDGQPGSTASGPLDSKIDGISFDSANFEAFEETGIARVTVNRSGDLSQAATVRYATSDATALVGQDYADETGLLTWAAGDGEAKTFDIQVIISAESEPAEAFTIELTDISGANYGDFTSASVALIDYQVECLALGYLLCRSSTNSLGRLL